MTPSAGYSKTPLIRKLGIKSGYSVRFVNQPDHYSDLIGPLPEDVTVGGEADKGPYDFIHLFADSGSVLNRDFPLCKNWMDRDGMIWVSWIKKASAMETDISEGDVRRMGLDLGLVDVKICAVDDDWSGLKFMYRKKDR